MPPPPFRALLVATIGVVLVTSVAAAGVRRVPQDHTTITAALAAAMPGDTVRVAAGAYSPAANGESFPLVLSKGGVVLLGAGAEATVLDAQATAAVVRHTASPAGRVSGFTITGGRAAEGGGVQVISGDLELDHNRLVSNGASVGGAALSAHGSAAPWIHHNVFLDNFATSRADVHALRLNTRVGGRFEHNLVAHSDGNGLLTVDSVTTEIRDNIFFRNGLPSPERGRGICWISVLPPHIHHNLFFQNQVAALFWWTGGGDYDAATADAQSPTDGVYANLELDPMFVDDDAGDYHLVSSSPAVDAGDPAGANDPDGTRADIGPYAHMQVMHVPSGVAQLSLASAPEPVRETTELRFTLPASAPIQVDVLDATGRRVRVIARGTFGAGSHRMAWDTADESGRRVSPGRYFVIVRAGPATRTLPVTVLR